MPAMEFTSFIYCYFLLAVVAVYWLIGKRELQNAFLVAVSYIFYGYVHPWFCLLIAASTLCDYFCGLAMEQRPQWKKGILIFSLVGNLSFLGFFKYFNFFVENVRDLTVALGMPVSWEGLEIILPVGISFYTFQTLSYTIDIYFGKARAERNLLDFALFVGFFPQLVAGPIERAHTLLSQIQKERKWSRSLIISALPLFLSGYLKKLVVADNISVWVDKVFLLQEPPFFLFFVGSLGFAIQIFADFSAYMDIAMGSSRLLGFELSQNFNAPFLAISPSDFWRRWHITFSNWIRDYIYIPLGGSRGSSSWKLGGVLLLTMGLSGLWHGAAWNYVAWGVYHGLLLYIYHSLGLGGKWKPASKVGCALSWVVFQSLSIFGWSLFRAPSLQWFVHTIASFSWITTAEVFASLFLISVFVAYSMLWGLSYIQMRWWPEKLILRTAWQWSAAAAIVLLASPISKQFIYFQF